MLALSGKVSLLEFASSAKQYLGEDEFAFLEASFTFALEGRLEEAWRILDSAKENSWLLSRYQLAYWSHRLGRDSEARAILKETETIPSDYVFPSQEESLEALEYATRETADGKAQLLQGNLLASLGRIDDAAESWREAARLDPGSSVAHRNLAMFSWKKERSLDRAVAHFQRAIEARPSDQTLYRDLARLHAERGRTEEAIEVLEAMPLAARRRPDATLDLARAYLALARFDEAIRLLAETTFSNWEGDSGTWQLYSSAYLGRGERHLESGHFAEALADFDRALEYPRNLNVGRPARPKEAKALFFRARALEALGRSGDAKESLERVAPPDGRSTRNRRTTSRGARRSSLGELEHHHAVLDVEGGARVPCRFLQGLAQHVLRVGAVLESSQEAVAGFVADGDRDLETAALQRLPSGRPRE